MERRKQARTDARLSMRVEGVPVDGQPAQVVTESQNISSSGVYCRSTHFLAPFSKVDLTIVLPRLPGGREGTLLKCEGIVVRCEPAATRRGDKGFQLACMFSGLEAVHRQLLEDYVTWRNLQSLRAAAAAAHGGG
ncbi:MAG TPA: PilZ domain-containing protein, partial [Candidatus Eisenbacteria bacterium]